jgi:hypothetical protein
MSERDADERGPGVDVQEGDVTDPAFWARAEFAIKAPVAPVLHSKLSCLQCSDGTAYGDGTGGYKCFRCGWSC